MHSRRFACLLLGMWLAGGLLITWMVSENSRAVDRLMGAADPAATLRIKAMGAAETDLLLRYHSAELTRTELELWQGVQICVGVFFLFFMVFGTGEGKISLALSLVLLLCVLVQRFAIWPEIVSYGRLTDFVPQSANSGYRAKLLVMQSGFLGVEIGKWVVLVVLSAILIGRRSSRRRGSSDDSWKKFQVVNKADDGHVDR